MTRALLDSSCWIELLTSGSRASSCIKELKAAREVVVPTLVLFEVYRKLTSIASEDKALSAIASMSQHRVVDLTREVALLAGDLSLEHKLATADSIVLAHARSSASILITLDNDFAGLPRTRVVRR